MFNNYDYQNNNLSTAMLYSLMNDLTYGHQNNQKFDIEMLYQICDNNTEKEIIDKILSMKSSFDGKIVLKRGTTRDHTFDSYSDVYFDVINNVNEQTNLKQILEYLELIIKGNVWE